MGALLGALGGAGLGAYSGNLRKSSGWRSSIDPRQELAAAIGEVPGIGFNQKSQFYAAVPKMSDDQVEELLQLLKRAGGFAAGALISKYLLGAGLIGTAVGGFLGAMFGGSKSNPRTAGGFGSMGNYDFRGNQIF